MRRPFAEARPAEACSIQSLWKLNALAISAAFRAAVDFVEAARTGRKPGLTRAFVIGGKARPVRF
jgi:hypothetical protein